MRSFASLLLFTVALLSNLVSSSATLFQVGGAGAQWTLGPTYPPITANVGDTLLFDFTSGHTVNLFNTQADFTNCNLANSVLQASSGPFTFTVASVPAWLGCSMPGHCDAGMKVAVLAASTPATPSSTGLSINESSTSTAGANVSTTAPGSSTGAPGNSTTEPATSTGAPGNSTVPATSTGEAGTSTGGAGTSTGGAGGSGSIVVSSTAGSPSPPPNGAATISSSSICFIVTALSMAIALMRM